MARNENLPFPRGSTFYDGRTIDSNNLDGLNLEGREYVVEDLNPDGNALRTNRKVTLRVVRNVAAAAILPKRLVRFDTAAGVCTSRVVGYSIASAAGTPQEGYPVDEYLPAAGCPVNDLCYIVIDGPAVVLTTLANMAADIAVNGWVVAATAATSGATTAGHVIPQDLSGATTPLAANIQNRVGRALTAALTNTTNTDVLVDVGHW